MAACGTVKLGRMAMPARKIGPVLPR